MVCCLLLVRHALAPCCCWLSGPRAGRDRATSIFPVASQDEQRCDGRVRRKERGHQKLGVVQDWWQGGVEKSWWLPLRGAATGLHGSRRRQSPVPSHHSVS
jgi:hypothetical protein